MEQPPGNLQKSLNGLHQSPRALFRKFSKVIQQIGMICCAEDDSVFCRHAYLNKVIYLVVYVDDSITIGDDQKKA
jgi:hypothetical protein